MSRSPRADEAKGICHALVNKGSGLFEEMFGCSRLWISLFGDQRTCPDHHAPTKREGFTTP